MVATYLRAQTTIPSASGLTSNQVVWTTHWKTEISGGGRTDDAQVIAGRIGTLLQALVPQSLNSSYGFGSSMRTAQAVTEVFDLQEPKPRVSFHTLTHSTVQNPLSTGQDFPPEVALCISFQGPRVSGRPQNRRRGRVYFGPLQFMNTSAADDLSPGSGGCAALAQAFSDTLQPGTSGLPEFCVLSRQEWAGLGVGEKPPPDPNTGEIIFPELNENLTGALTVVTEFWCDNAWDTQRRRGVPATVRSSVPVAAVRALAGNSVTGSG